jgi:DNA replication and repair protein RecF
MLQTINLENFRNHHLKSFDFESTATVIVGPNGVGKTNLLEAVYISSLTRSYRGNDSLLLRHKHHHNPKEPVHLSPSDPTARF